MVRAETLAALRGWWGLPDAALEDFTSAEQEAALRAVEAVRAVMADRVRVERFDRLESLREVGEPHIHAVLYARGSEQAEAIVRGA